MMVRRYRREFFTKLFWDQVATKLVSIFISVKVWGLTATTTISTLLLLNGYISGGEWTTVNGTVYSVVFGMREAFKIASVREYLANKEDVDKLT